MSTENEQPVESIGSWGDEPVKAETPPVDDAEPSDDEQNPETNDELQLSEDDELVEDDDDKGERKGRSKSARQRIDELTKARREAERERDELRAQLEGRSPQAAEDIGEAPNADNYEFGEADPKFIQDSISHGVKSALAEERKKAADEAGQVAQREVLTNLDNSWIEQTEAAVERYEDFDDKIADFQANAPCPPLMAIAIQASPVGADAAYHLASNQDEAELIATLIDTGNPASVAEAAERFGAIEGQFLTERPKHPGANAHPLDKALHAGRLKAYLENKGKKAEEKPAPKIATDAPDPPKKQARGAAGTFKASLDTDDMDAFYRDHGKALGLR